MGGLGVDGVLMVLGDPHDPLEVPAILVILGRLSIMGWYSGRSTDSEDTLSFCVLTGVRSTNEVFALESATEAYERMISGKARFRCALKTG